MTEAPVSPLRRRMIEDMTIRKLELRTQEGYIRAVRSFSAFLAASPDTASSEDLRRYHCIWSRARGHVLQRQACEEPLTSTDIVIRPPEW